MRVIEYDGFESNSAAVTFTAVVFNARDAYSAVIDQMQNQNDRIIACQMLSIVQQ